jgi:hypothetical protein
MIVGLSQKQSKAVEAACMASDPSWHDGLVRSIDSLLNDNPADAEVAAAIRTVFDTQGLVSPLDLAT